MEGNVASEGEPCIQLGLSTCTQKCSAMGRRKFRTSTARTKNNSKEVAFLAGIMAKSSASIRRRDTRRVLPTRQSNRPDIRARI